MIAPTDARRDLYGFQQLCAANGRDYVEFMWSLRYSDAPKSVGKWPAQFAPKAKPKTNVTPITRRKP